MTSLLTEQVTPESFDKRFGIEPGPAGGFFIIDRDNDFASEWSGTLETAINVRDHRNGEHTRFTYHCLPCRETPGMVLRLAHDPAAGFDDPNLSLGYN